MQKGRLRRNVSALVAEQARFLLSFFTRVSFTKALGSHTLYRADGKRISIVECRRGYTLMLEDLTRRTCTVRLY